MLSGRQVQLAGADQLVQPVLQLILDMGVLGLGLVGLRPEVLDGIRATDFQADEVIHLVLARLVALDTVLGVDLALDLAGNVSYLLRVAGRTDVLHAHVQRVTGRQLRIGQDGRLAGALQAGGGDSQEQTEQASKF